MNSEQTRLTVELQGAKYPELDPTHLCWARTFNESAAYFPIDSLYFECTTVRARVVDKYLMID